MNKQQKLKLLFTAVLFSAVLFVSVFFISNESGRCMGVKIVNKNFLDAYTLGSKFDTEKLEFNGETVASDEKWERIYISQPEDKLESAESLKGILSVKEDYQLYFINDQCVKDVSYAVKSNFPLSLAVIKDGEYRIIEVVITTLPVLRLEGKKAYVNDEGRDVKSGQLTLFAGFDPSKGNLTVTSCELEWHVRGGSSMSDVKQPQKLSLKQKGEIHDEDLLGLGSDDDWILNPLNRDDTDVREKSLMELWNTYFAKEEYNFKMSSGEYIEAIINGEYKGLYLLQRRIDRKYLELDKEKDILFKGMPTWVADTAEKAYEIIYSPYAESVTYDIARTHLMSLSAKNYHKESFIDLSLFFNYSVITDNSGFKNMYYVLKWDGNKYNIHLIPWDVDIAWGVTWKNDNFAYDYEKSMDVIASRMEKDKIWAIMEHEKNKYGTKSLEESLRERWKEIRESFLTEENVQNILDKNTEILIESGAKIRDKKLYSLYYRGEDTVEKIKDFANKRLYKLDEYYKYEK